VPSHRNQVFLYILVIVVAVWTVAPIYWALNLSLQFEKTIFATPTNLVPPAPTDYWYRLILGIPTREQIIMSGGSVGSMTAEHVGRGLKNSLFVALPTSLVAVAISVVSGYVFGRLKFKFKKGFMFMLLASQTLPPVAIILPYFVMFLGLGLVGTLHGLMIVYLSSIVPLVTWILSGFFAGLPLDVERAARLDGCGRLGVLFRVVLPMAAPGIIAGWVFAFLTAYNEFMYSWVLTAGTSAETLSPALTGLFFQDTTVPEMSAAVVLSLLPVIAFAIVLQRYIIELRIVDPVTTIVD